MLDLIATKRQYDSIRRVRCPYLGADVLFNDDGFDHLLFRDRRHSRPLKEQLSRLRSLPVAVAILKRSGTVQEYRMSRVFVRFKPGKKWSQQLVEVVFFCFLALVEGRRYKVIVRLMKGGEYEFHSVFPISEMTQPQESLV